MSAPTWLWVVGIAVLCGLVRRGFHIKLRSGLSELFSLEPALSAARKIGSSALTTPARKRAMWAMTRTSVRAIDLDPVSLVPPYRGSEPILDVLAAILRELDAPLSRVLAASARPRSSGNAASCSPLSVSTVQSYARGDYTCDSNSVNSASSFEFVVPSPPRYGDPPKLCAANNFTFCLSPNAHPDTDMALALSAAESELSARNNQPIDLCGDLVLTSLSLFQVRTIIRTLPRGPEAGAIVSIVEYMLQEAVMSSLVESSLTRGGYLALLCDAVYYLAAYLPTALYVKIIAAMISRVGAATNEAIAADSTTIDERTVLAITFARIALHNEALPQILDLLIYQEAPAWLFVSLCLHLEGELPPNVHDRISGMFLHYLQNVQNDLSLALVVALRRVALNTKMGVAAATDK